MRVVAAISTWLAVGFFGVFALGGSAGAEILKVEPDLYPEFTVLTIAYPGVTLSYETDRPGKRVLAREEPRC